jgi:RNase P protein component
MLREAFRLNRHRMSGSFDVVLVARRSILVRKAAEVQKDLMSLAAKAGLLGVVA